MDIVVRERSEVSVPDTLLLALFKDAFREREEAGVFFPVSRWTTADMQEELSGAMVFVALDKDSGQLKGTCSLYPFQDRNGVLYGHVRHAAISSSAKNSGVGSILMSHIFDVAGNLGMDHLRSGTSVKAKSSVKWHLKNGFRIIGLMSSSKTDYYSFRFRKQLIPSSKWDNPIYCKCKFVLSAIEVLSTRKADGSPTFLSKVLQKKK